MNAQPDDPRPDVVTRIAERTKTITQSTFGFDKRISIGLIGAVVVGGIGYAIFFGSVSQSFADLKATSSDHEVRVRGLEVGLGQANNEIAGIKGDIAGQLVGIRGELQGIRDLMTSSSYHLPHRPVSP